MKRQILGLVAGCCAFASVPAVTVAAAAHVPSNITAAVNDAGRPDEDRQRDADRKPAETLAFAGIKPGTLIAELVPGRGYWTRIFSKAVGPKGHVYALSPPRRPTAAADAPDPVAATKAIAEQPGYSNVSVQVGSLATISVTEPVDVVFTALNYHDVHNIPNVDIAAFNKSVFDALKPGGIFVVIDHAAAAGSGARDTATLHRIDAATVRSEVLAAGFEFAGESSILHTADPHTAAVFDPSVKGKTDQFLLKFRKPRGK